MIHVAIAEDDPNCAKQLERFLRGFGRESGRAFQITHYDNGEDLIEQYRSNFDLIFLDIEMPFVDGLTAAKHIRQIDPKVIMIFITNLAQYAIRGYEVNALDYIVKPIKYTSFSLHLSRAMPHLSEQEDACLVIAVKGGVVKLDPDSILYIESQKNQLLFHTAAQVHTSTVTLQKIIVSWIPCMAAAVGMMFLLIHVCTDLPLPSAGYHTIRAFLLAEFAASLEWQLSTYATYDLAMEHAAVPPLVLLLVYGAVFALFFCLERRWDDPAFLCSLQGGDLWPPLMIGLICFFISNLSFVYSHTPFSSSTLLEIFNIRLYCSGGKKC